MDASNSTTEHLWQTLERRWQSHWPFWTLLILWIVGSGVACIMGFWAVPTMWSVPFDDLMGVLVSLASACLTLLLSLLAIVNTVRLSSGHKVYDLKVPPSVISWLIRLIPVAIGILIGVTIFT